MSLFRNRLMRNDSHLERIDVERIVKVQGINNLGDFQYEVETLTAVSAIRQTGPAQTEESGTSGQELGMIARVCTFRQVDVDAEDRRVVRSTDILQIQEDPVRLSGLGGGGKAGGNFAADVCIELD